MTGEWRNVVGEPRLKEGRGSLLGPDTARRNRWWVLALECGHVTERFVRYQKRSPEERLRKWARTRAMADVLPAPRRVRCDECTEMRYPPATTAGGRDE